MGSRTTTKEKLTESRFAETAQLATVQLLDAMIAQQLQRANANLQMLRHPLLIKAVRHARQFDLAVQRLVGYAEQGAVRHPEAEAVRGHGCTLHIQRNRPALAEAQLERTMVAQLPVAIVNRGDRAGTHDALQLITFQLRDAGHRV